MNIRKLKKGLEYVKSTEELTQREALFVDNMIGLIDKINGVVLSQSQKDKIISIFEKYNYI